ncbi:MAG: hypothetical protein H7Z39_05325 [Burkholderiaceae bacterium]|nr:hypothetical protein [Burkholderiaceae bacterium]
MNELLGDPGGKFGPWKYDAHKNYSLLCDGDNYSPRIIQHNSRTAPMEANYRAKRMPVNCQRAPAGKKLR